ncbi:MAG: TolC family protein, partial [Armatimonadetes bacterium]|nr:TolC family protein [Armatimonadota bacterium]
ARRGEVDLARAQGRPELHADLAADFWSLDREPFRGDALGFQARLSFPLLDRSRRRAEVDQAQAGVREQEAEVAGVLRTVESELRRAAAELTAAREVVLNYRTGILPRSEELLTATQRGFEAGLSSFLEVLEAQRVYRTTRAEYGQALFEAVRAGVVLDRLLGNPLPGRAG